MKNLMERVLSEKEARNVEAMKSTARSMADEAFNPWAGQA
jgi:hypothetical protein